ncbi:nuclear/nucleolar GTPase 2-like [Solanum stenotomum]|uniref:nuclear/nucleolar GTPase 2-like n=1 Tax=Solanum stenotomum TaxID=172797 RepID=UPI0020D1EFE4|nr:nuclear/nucleolar GTPase 2-like [Solanum stenotomum]
MAKNKSGHRNSATTRRLKMYNCRPKRDRKGKILKHKYQSKQLPSTRIQLDPRWFINTRVISQEKSESFREEIQDRLSSNYNIIMNGSNLPMSLVNEHKKKGKVHQLDDSKPSARSKKNHANHFKSLAKKADTP